MDLNKAMIIGRLTRDPEIRSTAKGTQVASFSIATNTNWTNGSGEKQEKVEYHNIVAWQKLAEICGKYLKKGSKIYVEGRLETRSWDAQDGSKKSRTEIVARDMIMLDSKMGGAPRDTAASSTPAAAPKADAPAAKPAAEPEEETINLEEIPF